MSTLSDYERAAGQIGCPILPPGAGLGFSHLNARGQVAKFWVAKLYSLAHRAATDSDERFMRETRGKDMAPLVGGSELAAAVVNRPGRHQAIHAAIAAYAPQWLAEWDALGLDREALEDHGGIWYLAAVDPAKGLVDDFLDHREG